MIMLLILYCVYIAIVTDNLTSVRTHVPGDVVSSDVLATNQLPTKERKSSLQLVTGNSKCVCVLCLIIYITLYYYHHVYSVGSSWPHFLSDWNSAVSPSSGCVVP